MVLFKSFIEPQAANDIRGNIKYYSKISKALGKRFYLDFESNLSLLKQNPLSYQVRYKPIGNLALNSFPFFDSFSSEFQI